MVDLDTPKPGEAPPQPWNRYGVTNGADVFALVAVHHATIPATRTVTTPSGGRHLIYRAPADNPTGQALGNSAGRLGPWIDTRGHGGYVVASPTVLDAASYQLTDDRPPALLPGWLAVALTTPTRQTG